MESTRTQAKERLGALIERVMADGTIDEGEREEMQAFFRQELLTVGDVRDVMSRYLRAVQDEVLADGRVSRPRARAGSRGRHGVEDSAGAMAGGNPRDRWIEPG